MSGKTIIIDLEAYALLESRRRPGQSFSSVIKENFKRKFTVNDLLRTLSMLTLEEETLDHIEEQVTQRRENLAKIPRI